ncbi:MAG: hypothetical protein IPL52_02880 [Flavobacteriales bacterium]|nr:hypothetical protein [Flavobacteriales bacterium]
MKKALFLMLLSGLAASSIAVNVTLNSWNEQCGNNNGRIEANASGGQFPYAYLWSNGATTAVITGLDAGTYSVTVTDNLGAQANAQVTLIDVPEIQVPDQNWSGGGMGLGQVYVSAAGLHACPGVCNAGFAWSELSLTPNAIQPVSYSLRRIRASGEGRTLCSYTTAPRMSPFCRSPMRRVARGLSRS